MNRDDVVQCIYDAVVRINELREPDRHLVASEETHLYGAAGGLDSLNLVSLIMDVEEAINDRTGAGIVLADERAMSQKRNPFRDVRSLADYVMGRLQEGTA
jgi:acyl carrier protein